MNENLHLLTYCIFIVIAYKNGRHSASSLISTPQKNTETTIRLSMVTSFLLFFSTLFVSLLLLLLYFFLLALWRESFFKRLVDIYSFLMHFHIHVMTALCYKTLLKIDEKNPTFRSIVTWTRHNNQLHFYIVKDVNGNECKLKRTNIEE